MVAKGRFAMRPGLTLREDYDAARLRGVARRTKSATQGRRLLALAEIYDGGSRTKAACVGGGGLQTIRDWVLRFNAHGPEGLADRQAPGHPGKLKTAQREALRLRVRRAHLGRIDDEKRTRSSSLAVPRSRIFTRDTATGPMPVWIIRSGPCPCRTRRSRPSGSLRSCIRAKNTSASSSTACARSRRAPERRISVRGSSNSSG